MIFIHVEKCLIYALNNNKKKMFYLFLDEFPLSISNKIIV